MKRKHTARPTTRVAAIGLLAGALALLGLGLAGRASAVEVRGTVDVPSSMKKGAVDPENTSQFYWEEWNGFIPPTDPESTFDASRVLSVVLTGAGDGPDSAFEIRGGDFHPSTMVVRTGSKLRIVNTDGCEHELYAEGADDFPAMQTAPGNARVVDIKKAGHFVIRDRLYGHIEAHVHVLPNLVARASLDSRGRYVFANVAPGDYTLKVFYQDKELVSQPVTIEDSSRGVSLDAIGLKAAGR